ncbi:hypothetical protein PMAYCL1PPCAC_02369, partial [Pristionchus mayeri]
MKWVVVVALFGLSVAAQQQSNKTAEGTVQSADGRRSHRRHRDSEESFEAYPQYPVYEALPPNYDGEPPPPPPSSEESPSVNYCSIHASFPMTGGEEKRDRRDDENSDESDVSSDYARSSRRRHRGGRRHRNHRWNRQTCRFTATFSQETCQTCCRVSSRNNDADPSSITGALMFFAPWDESSAQEHNLKREVQCVCCAPRR